MSGWSRVEFLICTATGGKVEILVFPSSLNMVWALNISYFYASAKKQEMFQNNIAMPMWERFHPTHWKNR